MKYLLNYNIFEYHFGQHNKYSSSLDKNEFDEILNTSCKDFSWDDKPIYKGMFLDEADYAVSDPKSNERRSAWTSNYYTYLWDNSPYRKEYPKRSNSIICTSHLHTAESFGDVYRVIPFDGAKLAVCPKSDFWYSFEKLTYGLDDFNSDLSGLFNTMVNRDINSENKDLFLNDMKYLFNVINDEDKIENVKNGIRNNEGYLKSFIKNLEKFPKSLDDLFKIFDPHRNDFNIYDYNDYKTRDSHVEGERDKKIGGDDYEVFTDSKCLLIKIH